jgi:putative tryptophan/tyrosine transport system substrate-binding protein
MTGARWRWAGVVATTLVLIVLAAVAADIQAQPRRPFKIGALTESWGPTPSVVGLRDGLKDLGYREDVDFVIGVRFTQGNAAELPAAARDLVKLGVDMIVTDETGSATRAAQTATDRIPIVFVGGSDPVGLGLVKSLAHPGGNITGIADLDAELAPKRLEIFRELVPGLRRVLFPYDATNAYIVGQLPSYRETARTLNVTLVEKPLRTEDEVRAVLAGIKKEDVDGIMSPRTLSLNIPGFILEAAQKHVAPTMFQRAFYVERGGLASYAGDGQEFGRLAARLVDKIIKGARPGDVPVEQVTKFELAINVKAAKALGLSIPQSLLLRADRVIQ